MARAILAVCSLTVVITCASPAGARDSAAQPPAPAPAGRGSDKPQSLEAEREEYEFQSGIDCPFCIILPGHPEHRGLHWHDYWNRVGLREYIVTPVLFGAALAAALLPKAEDEADWRGPILFDSQLRAALMLQSRSARTTAKTVSDVFAFASVAHTMVVDDILVSWVARESPDVAWQMFVINSQAYALTLALNAATKRLTSRERPYGPSCDVEDTGEFSCNSGMRFRAFYSGHAAVTATGAGLLCAHHTQLRLYMDPTADVATCAAGIALTAATGALRVASDNHWASDVLVGHLMGYVSGYLLPTLLYYKEFRVTPREHEHPPSVQPQMAVLPLVAPESVQVEAIGRF